MERLSEGEKRKRVEKSLQYSVMDGTFYSSMVGFGESFFSAFAVFLKATNTQLGLIGSLPQTVAAVSQLASNWLLGVIGSRKRIVVGASLLQAVMYVLVALVIFFGEFRLWILLAFICVYWVFGSILGPAWSSWMGDLVPERKRGDYFGRRNKMTGFVTFATFTLGGYLLQRHSGEDVNLYLGFVLLFFVAMVSRLASVYYLSRKYEPDFRIEKSAQFSFIDFIREARFHNYGLFVIYLGAMNFAVYISAPFFTPYMLNHLGFDYVTFTVITATALVVKFLAMPVWGRLSDRYGTKKVLTASGFLMPMVPILWIFSSDVWYLVAIQAYSGFAWAGFEMASFNFILDSTTPEKRATCVAYYNVVTGLMIFAGAMLGRLVVNYARVGVSVYLLVFLTSYVARSLTSIFFLPRLHERRRVQSISYKKLIYKAVHGMPTMGMVMHLVLFGMDEKIERKR
jgi:MFS family permease